MRPVCTSCDRVVYVNPIPASCQVVFEGDRVLLVKRAVEPKRGMWCLPGGFVEWGENPEETARRELVEETGIVADDLALAGVYGSMSGERRHVLLVAYLVTAWHGDPVAGDDAEDVGWFASGSMPPLAFEAHEQALADARELVGGR